MGHEHDYFHQFGWGHEFVFVQMDEPWNTYNLFALNTYYNYYTIKLWESDSVQGLIKVTAILHIFMYSRMCREIFPMTYDGPLKFFLGSQDGPPGFGPS
jgi:hypothetical protein